MLLDNYIDERESYAGGRWTYGEVPLPSSRPRIHLERWDQDFNIDIDQLGFVNFGKFFSRALHKTPFEKIGKTIGRALNIALPITMVREDVRKQALKDIVTVVKRVPQMAVGAAAGFAAGGPIGAIGGAAMAGLSKGKGFKFKVFGSGIMPGLTGAGLVGAGQALGTGLKVGVSSIAEKGVLGGIKTGFTAGQASAAEFFGQSPIGKLTSWASKQVPSFVTKGVNVLQTTGIVPDVPLSPLDVVKSQAMNLVSSVVTPSGEEYLINEPLAIDNPQTYEVTERTKTRIEKIYMDETLSQTEQAYRNQIEPYLIREYRKRFDEKIRGQDPAYRQEAERIWRETWIPQIKQEAIKLAKERAAQDVKKQASQYVEQVEKQLSQEKQRLAKQKLEDAKKLRPIIQRIRLYKRMGIGPESRQQARRDFQIYQTYLRTGKLPAGV